MTMGSFASGMPRVLVAPQQPLVVRRADVTDADTVNRLRAESKRVFARYKAVYEG